MKYLFIALLLLPCPALASTAPTFTRGTMTSRTESFTRVSETYNIVEYSTGSSYTMTGTNVQWQGKPQLGTVYTQVIPGCATQFTESYLGPGLASETNFTRVTEITSVTDSVSVFTQ